MIKLALFTPPTKKPTISHPMSEQTDPLHLPGTIDVYPDFTPGCFRVRFNAHQLENGVISCYVEDIFNCMAERFVRDPYTQEMRVAVEDAIITHFEDEAFTCYHVTDTKVYF